LQSFTWTLTKLTKLAWTLTKLTKLAALHRGWFTLYMVVRTIESHWFVWVTQMSHIPMT
jgi:hypothetical protein